MTNPDRIARLGTLFPDLTLGDLEALALDWSDVGLMRAQANLAHDVATLLWAVLDASTPDPNPFRDEDNLSYVVFTAREAVRSARPFLPTETEGA
jgi:hypothetical protein